MSKKESKPPTRPHEDEEAAIVARLAEAVVRRGLTTPAILLLELHRPLNFVASQFMAFAQPFASLVFDQKQYDVFQRLLERRESVELIIRAIEEREAAKGLAEESGDTGTGPGRRADETEAS